MMKLDRMILVTAVFMVGLMGIPLVGQEKRGLTNRLETVEESVRALSKEVAELSALLRAALPPSPVLEIPAFELSVARAAVRGSTSAKIVVVEYTDFECPFCGRHAQSAYRELQRQFVETGKIKYAVLNLPLTSLHSHALKAAEAAECAGQQGKYWEMHDRLFANQNALATADLFNHARSLNLDFDEFQSCLVEGKMVAKVNEDLAEAQRLGLTGTPAFLIGETSGDATIRVTQKISGAQPFQVFQAALQRILSNTNLNTK